MIGGRFAVDGRWAWQADASNATEMTPMPEPHRTNRQMCRTAAAGDVANRIMVSSALTASIAHEVNQPLSGIITNAGTCLRLLDAHPPNVEGARETGKVARRPCTEFVGGRP